MVFIFLFVFIVVVGLTNTAVFKLAGKHRGRRLWSGLILILLSPIVFLSRLLQSDLLIQEDLGQDYLRFCMDPSFL